ncbi:MAG: hypothetical protein IKI61_01615 [Erysipelotrichaceae bacterium]|nr:hypothetical protein [Erysipelotrichaceae bacterium]
MNYKNLRKNDRFIIICIIASVIIALIATIADNNHKQSELETMPVAVETEPEVSETAEPAPEETAPAENTDSEQTTAEVPGAIVVDSGSKFPHPMYIYSGWDRCLEQLQIDCDIAFLGDSITYYSYFDQMFPDYEICNMGIPGDTIRGVKERTGVLETIRPEKVFLLIGVNSLKDDNADVCLEKYTALVENVRSRGDFDLYLISILPISQNTSTDLNLSPDTIISFNGKISELSDRYNATYLDLFSQLQDSGYIRPEYTVDGLHLSEEAYDVWADAIRPYIEGN